MLKLLAFFFFAASAFVQYLLLFMLGFQGLLGLGAHPLALELLFNGTLHPLRVQLPALRRLNDRRAEPQPMVIPEQKVIDFIVLRLCAKGDLADLQPASGLALINTQKGSSKNTVKLLEIVTILMSSFK